MIRKEILEIKKQFSAENCNIRKMHLCYVNSEKEKVSRETTVFLALPEEEAFKYFEIFKKSLTGAFGKNLYQMPLGNDTANDYVKFREACFQSEEALEAFEDQIIASYEQPEPYLIILAEGIYDIPGKFQDGSDMDESESVYHYLLCSICPVKLSKPGLSFHANEQKFKDRIRDWVVADPQDAFLFPAFDHREENISSVLYYNKKQPQDEFLKELFHCERPMTVTEEKVWFSSALEKGTNPTFEKMKAFHEMTQEKLCEKQNDGSTDVSKDELVGMLKSCGFEDQEVEYMKEALEQREEKNIHLDYLSEQSTCTVKTSDCTIKLKNSYDIETKKIDGRLCFVIPVNESHMEMNSVVAEAGVLM